MKMTKSQLRSIKRQLAFLQRELKQLESKARKGWLTESEKQHMCNWLAKEYLHIAKQFGKFTDYPQTSGRLSEICLDMAVGLKELGAIDNKFSYRPRKGFEIHRKVMTPPKDWRF